MSEDQIIDGYANTARLLNQQLDDTSIGAQMMRVNLIEQQRRERDAARNVDHKRLTQIFYLVQRGVPWEVAFTLSDVELSAYVVAMQGVSP